jgi:hypothetical protein
VVQGIGNQDADEFDSYPDPGMDIEPADEPRGSSLLASVFGRAKPLTCTGPQTAFKGHGSDEFRLRIRISSSELESEVTKSMSKSHEFGLRKKTWRKL